jgi:hypothetical protein
VDEAKGMHKTILIGTFKIDADIYLYSFTICMKKITELRETRWRTVHLEDASGDRHVETEEYTAYRQVKTVSPGPRFMHYIIDVITFQVIIYLLKDSVERFTGKISQSPEIDLTTFLYENSIVIILYIVLYTLCEYKLQRTPAKFFTKTVVIDEYGNKPALTKIMLRTFIRLVPFEPFSCYDAGYSYGWHDRWSKTWVVTEDEWAVLKRLQTEQQEEVIV